MYIFTPPDVGGLSRRPIARTQTRSGRIGGLVIVPSLKDSR